MFRVQELTHFGAPTRAVAPELPSAALAGAAWAQITEDPFFIEINPTEMGYRSAPKGFAADNGARRVERRRHLKALPTFSMAALGRALHPFGGGNRHFAGA